MSVTFTINGYQMDEEEPSTFLNISNTSARELLDLLCISGELWGQISADELMDRIEDVEAAGVPSGFRPGFEASEPGKARAILCGRSSEVFVRYLQALRELCDRAGATGVISWD